MESEHRPERQPSMMLDSVDAPGGVIVYYADGDEEIIHVNQYVIDLFECDDHDDFMQFVGGSFRNFVHQEDIDIAEDSIWGQVVQHGNYDHIYYRIRTKTGRIVQVEDFGKLVETPGERPVFYVFAVEMKELGAIDWLTGLPTMSRFHSLVQIGADQMRSRGERPVAMALDLMGLKSFNSQYGRKAGDELIRAFADVLRKHFGHEACSRFAEDHFYAFASEDGLDDRIEELFADFATANDGKVLPVRVGLYACGDEDDIIDVGFDRAKYACDLDRTTWQSHAIWFSDELKAQEDLKAHIREHLDQAISAGWLKPHYQCIMRAATGNACGEEALARWDDPEYGNLMAETLIPALEDTGLLHKLDMHMIDCVLADMNSKRATGTPIVPVSVNMSLRDFGKTSIASEVAKRAEAAGIPCDLLRIEISESAALEDADALKEQIASLHAAGIEVWLDDFGSGYSSLNTLREFDFDVMKLDMELIGDVHSEKSRGIIRAIIQAANKIGIGVLAEGVETEDQDRFLESAGCNMLQGYYYTASNPIDVVVDRAERGIGVPREDMAEFAYWNTIGAVDLADPTTSIDSEDVEGNPITEFPSGIMEIRDGSWRILRANRAYKEFLANGGIIGSDAFRYATPVIEADIDADFRSAVERCSASGKWERVAGRQEYGTGLQFYIRPLAITERAEAYIMTTVPTMLGTALGTYGDVPVGYAVMKAILGDTGDELVDAEFVFANSVFCKWTGYPQSEIPGRSFSHLIAPDELGLWLPFFYRAAILKEEVHDVDYSPSLGHWLSFNAVPSQVEDCFVLAFSFADAERQERQEMLMGLDTSRLVIGIANMFNKERDYDAAMNKALKMISRAVHPERLRIFERKRDVTTCTFEWCAPGIEPLIQSMASIPNDILDRWNNAIQQDSVVVISDVEELKGIDEQFYRNFKDQGISRALVVILYADGQIVGYLSASDYELEDRLDVRRLLETVATSISARIANRRLLEELERTGTHDGLTTLLNRRGIDLATETRLANDAVEPFVLALIDVDDFKTLNDVYGHAAGDEALRCLARTLTSTFSDDSIVGRNGGDEFLVMLFGEEAARADALFGKLTSTGLHFSSNEKSYQTTISVGYVEYPGQADSLKSAYTMADVALYAVKLSGKAGYRKYSPEFEMRYRSSLAFSSRAIAENTPSGVVILDSRDFNTIFYANSQAIGLVGFTSFADFMRYTAERLDAIVHPDDVERMREAHMVAALERGQDKVRCAFRVVSASGTVRNVVANSHLVDMDEIGEVFYMSLLEA